MRQDGQQVLARLGDDHEEAFRWGLERFRDEGRILARFSHPNLVRVIGDFEAHGTHYIVMAYVEGETLSARLAREGPLGEERSLTLVLPVVDGLEQVHAAGYLHRDIKPSNIVIGADGTPVLLDFGAARRALGDRTHSLTAVVSDGYAPLEQYARDSRQGPWTDIYALGAVLYRCLTNRPVPEAPARAGADELVPAAEASPYRLSQELIDARDAALAVLAADRPPTLAAWRQMFGRSRYVALEWPVTAARGDDSAPDFNGTVAGAATAGAAALSTLARSQTGLTACKRESSWAWGTMCCRSDAAGPRSSFGAKRAPSRPAWTAPGFRRCWRRHQSIRNMRRRSWRCWTTAPERHRAGTAARVAGVAEPGGLGNRSRQPDLGGHPKSAVYDQLVIHRGSS